MSENVTRIPLRNMRREIVAWTIIDASDEALVMQFAPYHRDKGNYAVGYDRSIPGQPQEIRLHRLILGLVKGDGLEGDHINHDRLDNRRSNLRAVSLLHNRRNTGRHRDGSSQYRGVSWFTARGKWRARATMYGVEHTIGYFDDEHEAAAAVQAWRIANMPGAVG